MSPLPLLICCDLELLRCQVLPIPDQITHRRTPRPHNAPDSPSSARSLLLLSAVPTLSLRWRDSAIVSAKCKTDSAGHRYHGRDQITGKVHVQREKINTPSPCSHSDCAIDI
jgi:hypothetical protein